MKKIITLILICTILPVAGFAQQDRPEKEKRRAELEKFQKKRIEYITKAMKLNDKQEKVFWPVCFEFWDKKFEIDRVFRRKIREFMKDEREGKEHSESDYRQIVETFAEKQFKEAEINKEYMQKFLEILPAEKVFLFQDAEQNFMREILNERRKPEKKNDK
jgi:hypothetical protein